MLPYFKCKWEQENQSWIMNIFTDKWGWIMYDSVHGSQWLMVQNESRLWMIALTIKDVDNNDNYVFGATSEMLKSGWPRPWANSRGLRLYIVTSRPDTVHVTIETLAGGPMSRPATNVHSGGGRFQFRASCSRNGRPNNFCAGLCPPFVSANSLIKACSIRICPNATSDSAGSSPCFHLQSGSSTMHPRSRLHHPCPSSAVIRLWSSSSRHRLTRIRTFLSMRLFSWPSICSKSSGSPAQRLRPKILGNNRHTRNIFVIALLLRKRMAFILLRTDTDEYDKVRN